MSTRRDLVSYPHVSMSPGVLAGSPVIEGSRVPVRRLWAWHRGGTSIETLLRRFPQLGAAKVLCALAFAYDNQELVEQDLARENELLAQTTGDRPPGLRPMAQTTLPGVDAPKKPVRRRLPRARLRRENGGSDLIHWTFGPGRAMCPPASGGLGRRVSRRTRENG